MLRLQGLSDAPQAASGAAGPAGTGSASSGAASSGAAKAGPAFTSQTYPGLAASAQKAAPHPRWPAVGAGGKGAAKPAAAQKATVQ